jgi:hypothetical protein
MTGGSTVLTTTGANNFLSPVGMSNTTTSEANRQMKMPVAGTFRGLRCEWNGAPDNGAGVQSYTCTFRKNNVDGAQSCTTAETETECGPSAAVDAGVAGDDIAINCVASGTPTARAPWCSMEFCY